MNSDAFRAGHFDYRTHFNLGNNIAGAVRQGVYGLIYYFGNNQNNHLRLLSVMHAFRRSVRQGGNHPFDASIRDLPLHDTRIAYAFIAGIQHMLNRFGDTTATRYAIIQIFRELEGESEADGHKPLPFDWDKDDDPEGPAPKGTKPEPGTGWSWGDVGDPKLPYTIVTS